ncbi:MAG TPA: bifunctional D-glycero-beta-D-manno-heptose-7-phosphate kinase/D-glycero-beta-D-manno-heptose 1-phosphate adenylyltransferase HldE [Coxiellaceae bacterium]|nr:bifunctional D-glycero-beta-D-manno-heptose-7-phosphate kinase/D-glycero-beta-D-manno-heptose 1-phosphate adenylyltransferase HldE [Coxiellaceae bacterium]
MLTKLSLPPLNNVSVLVCGDVMLDRYWYGDTSRISPEAPVPVVHVHDMKTCPGGAANVALNIAAVGAQATLMGIVGNDVEASDLQQHLLAANVKPLLLKTDRQSTTTKLRVLSQNQQLIRLDFEHKHTQGLMKEELLAQFKQHLSYSQVVILSDYAKGVLSCAPELIALARAQGIPVLVDPKSLDFNCYRGANLITPNMREFEAVVGHCANNTELVGRATKLVNDYEIDALLVTRGKEGMSLIQKNGKATHIPSFARDVYDVSGAGDTVIGILAACMAAGSNLEDAAAIANLAAGLVVAKLGTATVSVSELQRAIRHQCSHQGGILTETELLQLVAEAKLHGETVVMTNGCFDILHSGHVQYLQQAKNLGDHLIVAVNTDDSVSRLKGPTRPLNSLEDRLQILVALEAVDAVVEFSEDTPLRLIEAVLPDVLVKGGDYTVNEIAGAEAVINNGGKVIILDFKEGRSTTRLIEKVKTT